MGNHSFFHRIDELKHIIESNDHSRGTRRLMDFCQDFEVPDDLYSEVLDLRTQFNFSTSAINHFDQDLSLGLALLKLLEQIEVWGTSQFGENIIDPEWAESEAEEIPVDDSQQAPRKPWKREIVFKGKNIYKSYRSTGAKFELEVDDLILKRGEITGVVGANGNGKTTLLRIVAGDLSITDGELQFPFTSSDKLIWEKVKEHIAYIPQRLPKWFGSLRNNLQFSASIHGIHGAENRANANHVLHRLGLSKYENATWSEISTGYKLRFELAKALVWHPRLLVLDEPLANLDINTRAMFLQDLCYIANSLKYPVSIIISSQQLQEVEEVSDNILFLEAGKPLYNGKVREFGKERAENLFEFVTETSYVDLKAKLTGLDDLVLEDKGQIFLVKVPVDFPASRLLQLLINKNVEVSYFREISQSTRKLFRQTHA